MFIEICMFSRAPAQDETAATRFKSLQVFLKLLLQNGRVKHRDLLRTFGKDVLKQAASVGTV